MRGLIFNNNFSAFIYWQSLSIVKDFRTTEKKTILFYINFNSDHKKKLIIIVIWTGEDRHFRLHHLVNVCKFLNKKKSFKMWRYAIQWHNRNSNQKLSRNEHFNNSYSETFPVILYHLYTCLFNVPNYLHNISRSLSIYRSKCLLPFLYHPFLPGLKQQIICC